MYSESLNPESLSFLANVTLFPWQPLLEYSGLQHCTKLRLFFNIIFIPMV